MSDKPEQMNDKLGNIYNDYMNEAHGGYPGKYTRAERSQLVRELLEKGVLKKGIDIYHAALLLDNGGTRDDKMQIFEMYKQAGLLGYEPGFHSAALTYDTWRTSHGHKQRYGTHWTNQEDAQGNPIPKPLEDPEHVDEIRAELHLPPLAQEAAGVAAMNRQVRELQDNYKRNMNG